MTIPAFTTTPNSQTAPTTFATDMDTWLSEVSAWSTAANALAVAMQAIAAGGAVSLQYVFSTTTTDADPGAGTLRLDAATQNTATTIRTDLTGADGSDLTGVLALLDDSTSTTKGYITLRHSTTPTKWLVFAVTALASPSGYKNITVTCAASSAANPFTNGDSLLLDFSPTGDKGTTGDIGPAGPAIGAFTEIFKTANADSPLTAAQASGTIVSNYGMTDADCTIDLPTAAVGLSFVAILPAVRARFFKFHCPAAQADKIYLLGVAGADDGSVGVASGYATGASASFFTFKASDGGYDWFCVPIFGSWAAS